MAQSTRIGQGSADITGGRRVALLPVSMPPPELAVPVMALLLWAISLEQIVMQDMNDLGLVSVLPWLFFASIGVLTCGFVIGLRRRSISSLVMVLHIAALIVILFGTTSVIEDAPRFAATWKHIGIADYIIRNEQLDPTLDAYFSWPGAFVVAALLTEVAGLDSPVGLASWASMIFNLLYLAPLIVLFRSLVDDPRVQWLGVWLFYLGNWIGQDYFAPQALDYFLYLSLLAVLMYWFPAPGLQARGFVRRPLDRALARFPRIDNLVQRTDHGERQAHESTAWQRVALIGIAVLILAAMVPSHQLTPVATVLTLGILALFGRLRPAGMAILAGIMVAAWVSFATTPFLLGHLAGIASGFGQLNQNVESGLSERVSGSDQHIFVVRMRLVMSAAVVALAGLGLLRRVTKGRWDVVPALLVGAPALVLALQAYGGEGLLRAYFFSLPGLALLAANLFFPTRVVASWRTLVAIVGVGMALFAGFLFARYGNERMDYYTNQEIAAVGYLYAEAPDGAVLIAGGPSLPWKAENYETFNERVLPARMIRDGNPEAIAHYMRNARRTRGSEPFFVVTRATSASVDLFYGLEPGALDRLIADMIASGEFRVVYSNEDATILGLPVPLSEDEAESTEP